MTQDRIPNFFTFSNHDQTIQISYYPQAPGPIIQGQGTGPRFEYQGPEGNFLYPQAGPGRESIQVQEVSVLGPQITVVLVPTTDAKSVTLTLLLPPVNLAGHEHLDFHTLAIKTTSHGMLPKAGARLAYEAIHLRGKAQHILFPRTAQEAP